MLKKTLLAALLTAGIAASMADTAHGAGFVCAYKEAPNAPKNLGPAKGLEKDMSQLIAQKHLADLVAGFARDKFPPALIVDHLVWSYCPLVENDKSLTDAQKADLVRRFASKVAGLAYAPAGPAELDILVDLPVVPALLVKIDEAAKARGISRDAWIKRAIDQSLATP